MAKVVKAILHTTVHLGPFAGQVGPTLDENALGKIGSVTMRKTVDGLVIEGKGKSQLPQYNGKPFEAFIPNGNIQLIVMDTSEEPKKK